MSAITTFVFGFIVTEIIGTLIFGTLWGCVTLIFNTLMDAQFTSFTGLNSFIKILSGMPDGNEFTVLLQKMAMTILLIVLLFSVMKSMAYPLTGKESSPPMTVLMKGCVATVCIGLYPNIVDFIIEILNTFASSSLFHTTIDLAAVDIAGLSIATVFDVGIILNIIAVVSIFSGMFMAGVSYLERYLSFALYIALGPICFAFFPGKDTESLLKEWFMGVLSQIFGILICLFALTMVGNQLEGIGFIDGFVPNNVVGATTIAKFLVALALLGFVRNSEQFINMLGLRTMPNQDAARSFFGAFATTAGLGLAAVKGFSAGKDAIEKHFNGEKLGSTAVGSILNRPGRNMVDKATQVQGNSFAEQTKNRQLASARAIAQTQMAQGENGNRTAMDKKDFMKWQEKAGVGRGNSNAAYAAYKDEFKRASDAQTKVLYSNEAKTAQDGKAYYSTKTYKGKGNIESSTRSVNKADLSTGFVNKYNTGVTPLSNAMEFTSEAMQSKGIRGFAFMGEVVGPDGKTTQKPMAAFIGQQVKAPSVVTEGNKTTITTGSYEAVDPTVISAGGFYGVNLNEKDANKLDKTSYIPFGSNGEFHTAENGVMVAELKDTVDYSYGGSVDKKTGEYEHGDHYIAHFGMNGDGDFEITHVDAPPNLADLRFDMNEQLSNLSASQYHTETVTDSEGKETKYETTSIADSLYNIEQQLMRQKDVPVVEKVTSPEPTPSIDYDMHSHLPDFKDLSETSMMEPEGFEFEDFSEELLKEFADPESIKPKTGDEHEL